MHVQSGAPLDIAVASRSAASFEAAKRDRPELQATRFVACDIDDPAALASAVQVSGFRVLGFRRRAPAAPRVPSRSVATEIGAHVGVLAHPDPGIKCPMIPAWDHY